ncbi:MAG: transcription termination factor NusA, partial [Oscillospiraceae bacterium]|nr:transcription termination factor NusA [Oscillospiraceae bacterium]
MAKKAAVAKSNELDGKEFFAAIELIEKERGISKEYMIEKISQALISAYKRDHESAGDNISVECNEQAGEVRMYLKKDVVEEVDNPATEISLTEARERLPRVELGDVIRIELKPRNFGRIAAQTARQVIIQGMREAERGMVYDEFATKTHEILTGVVTRVVAHTGAVTMRLTSGGETTDAFLTPAEQVKGEEIQEGDRLKVYVVEVRHSTRGAQVMISRTHPGLVKRLFEMEVPEIYDGTVEVKSIAREAGSRTKMAVWSADENVDPIGACVGAKGQRVNSIVYELNGEKIDIIKYSDDPATYVAAALAPASVVEVRVMDGGKSCRVIVPDEQLSLAIGKEGQNARLAARLTGCKIDIKPVSAADEEPLEEEEPQEEEGTQEPGQQAQD